MTHTRSWVISLRSEPPAGFHPSAVASISRMKTLDPEISASVLWSIKYPDPEQPR